MLSDLKKFLPEGAFLQEVLHVKVNSKGAREAVISRGRGRFALVTPFIDKYAVPSREPGLSPYLCVVRFVVPHSAGEILQSLDGKPFEAASLGRLIDLCRSHPKRRFGYRLIFLGSSWCLGPKIGYTAYPCLTEGEDGTRRLPSVLDRRRFKSDWRVALQPAWEEVSEILGQIVEEQRLLKEIEASVTGTEWIRKLKAPVGA